MDLLKKSYPGREPQIDQLAAYFGPTAAPFPPALYIRGGPSTGKSSIVAALLQALHLRHAVVNLRECYSSRVLFELALNQLTGHRVDPKTGAPYAPCDHFMDFAQRLAQAKGLDGAVLVLDHAEELRTMDQNLLPGFLGLAQLSTVRVSVVLLSELAFEKYRQQRLGAQPLQMHFPQYSQAQLLEILALDFAQARGALQVERPLFRSYLELLLPVFYRACRDLRELRHMSRKHFAQYCRPIVDAELTAQDSLALWKRIAPAFNAASAVLYLRVSGPDPGQLELPFYSKFLLIAAYLASYNGAKHDQRLFMKGRGKTRKSRNSAHLNTQMGPKAFSLDRLLAIFYAILDERAGFNNHLLVQVSSLVALQLLSLASDGSGLDERKYKCNVDFDTVQGVARLVGFNVRKYLSDFSHL